VHDNVNWIEIAQDTVTLEVNWIGIA